MLKKDSKYQNTGISELKLAFIGPEEIAQTNKLQIILCENHENSLH